MSDWWRTPDLAGNGAQASRCLLPADHPTGVEQWLVHAPGISAAWSDYLVALIRLCDVPGYPPAKREHPEAEFEVMVCALHPDKHPDPREQETWAHLTPVNHVIQFGGCSEEAAQEVLRAALAELLRYPILLEPVGLIGARDHLSRLVKAKASPCPA